ncbi:uncharacterized protein METZ01_LOCUS447476, partial [marine metagenome]
QDNTAEGHTGVIMSTIANADDDNTAVPTFSGSIAEDAVLTADYSPLSGNDEDGTTDADANSGAGYSYQWHRCTSTTASTCSDISSATSSTYTLVEADVGKYIRVAVSYTDDYSTAETVNSAINSNAVSNVADAGSISGADTGSVTEDDSTTATGTPTVTDPDSGEDTLQDVSAGTDSVSGYGTYGVSSGTWTYTLDSTDSAVQALAASATMTDTFVVTSADGSDTQTTTITITGVNDDATFGGDTTGGATEDTSDAS